MSAMEKIQVGPRMSNSRIALRNRRLSRRVDKDRQYRHCEPTGRANSRPMTGLSEAIHRAEMRNDGLLRRLAPRRRRVRRSHLRSALHPQGDLPGVSSPFVKYFPLFLSGKSSLQARPVPPEGGASAIVTNVGRDAVDAFVPDDDRRESGR